ncbi:hypothetical protein NZD89_04155 [Alicyclobacillus fastidiosus]|uniref:Uncharacterized protein n=1 Tax=Alicyclobacillus fastidiosus TaxID=392011 RepID=A0ABY6ZKM7_9BACL|nr:hypothetical protein [Alicyclobacillus fastidiosus]WAH42644.1 hypothetical protein NZD89_04155 [Alicyclobacillus fastidiosus]
METIEQYLDKLEEISSELTVALLNGDAMRVQTLVADQCQCMADIQKYHITDAHKIKLKRVHGEVLQQQVLIRQALDVTQYFLQRLHGQTSFSSLA